jgi:hypothetical protein
VIGQAVGPGVWLGLGTSICFLLTLGLDIYYGLEARVSDNLINEPAFVSSKIF